MQYEIYSGYDEKVPNTSSIITKPYLNQINTIMTIVNKNGSNLNGN